MSHQQEQTVEATNHEHQPDPGPASDPDRGAHARADRPAPAIPTRGEQQATGEARSVTGLGIASVPPEIAHLTAALASRDPPTDVEAILKVAWWWHCHGDGDDDPIVQWALEWCQATIQDCGADETLFEAFLRRLVAIEFVDDWRELRP